MDSSEAAAVLWDHDRRILANWLLRETGANFEGAKTQTDGSSFVSVNTALGMISLHDYWSFARHDFNGSSRVEAYQDALRRQVPVLSIGYTRPDAGACQTVVFINGELDSDAAAGQSFAAFTKDHKPNSLICVETLASGKQTSTSLYTDPFLYKVLSTLRAIALTPPVQPS